MPRCNSEHCDHCNPKEQCKKCKTFYYLNDDYLFEYKNNKFICNDCINIYNFLKKSTELNFNYK